MLYLEYSKQFSYFCTFIPRKKQNYGYVIESDICTFNVDEIDYSLDKRVGSHSTEQRVQKETGKRHFLILNTLKKYN